MLDFDSILAATTADNQAALADNGKSASAFPDFPGESPPKAQLKTWVETWKDDLQNTGYAPLLRGELPHTLMKLAPRALLPVPAGSDPADVARRAAVENENAKIAHTNAINKAESDAQLLELKTRMATSVLAGAAARGGAEGKPDSCRREFPKSHSRALRTFQV